MESRLLIFFLELTTALIVALILSGLFAFATRRRGQRTGILWIFMILFFATWAGGVWIRPFGPTLFGIHWMMYLLIGLILALIMAASGRHRAPRGRRETLNMLDEVKEEHEMEQFTYITLSMFFWVLLLSLIAAVVIRYVV